MRLSSFSQTICTVRLLFTVVILDPSSIRPFEFVKDTEDFYVQHFGIFPNEFRSWDKIRNMFVQQKMDDLKKYCAEIHKRGGNGTILVQDVLFKERTLSFTQARYKPRKIDVLSYSIDNSTQDRTYEYFVYPEKVDLLHIAQGWRPDCVYYVRLFGKDGDGEEEFRIDRPVCGIPA